jgi:hypothetical protein
MCRHGVLQIQSGLPACVAARTFQLRDRDKGPPDLRGLIRSGSSEIDTYSVEKVPAGVHSGMRRGGTFAPAGDFGWLDENDRDVNAPVEAFETTRAVAGVRPRRVGLGPRQPVDDDPLRAA